MHMIDEIRKKRDAIYAMAREHKAERLWVFWSCARREETAKSDVDFLVRFAEGTSLLDQGGLIAGLSSILGRSVDVVDSDAMNREPFFAYAVKKDLVAL